MNLPSELTKNIFEFDSTYHEHFQHVVKEINLFTTKKLALDYFDGICQHWPTYFRFFQNGIWYTAEYFELKYNRFFVTLYNEEYGTCSLHVHEVYHFNIKSILST
jgi:hypothetical protein